MPVPRPLLLVLPRFWDGWLAVRPPVPDAPPPAPAAPPPAVLFCPGSAAIAARKVTASLVASAFFR